VSGPNVPVSGLEDGARECTCYHESHCSICARRDPSAHRGWCPAYRPVVADTTAGEAEVERVAAALWEAQQGVSVTPWAELGTLSPTRNSYRDYARAALAARSGGAQDDGLRERQREAAMRFLYRHTGAGEAELAEGRRLVANVLGLPEANQIEVGADLIARSLAARSGGAQDDGLRERQREAAMRFLYRHTGAGEAELAEGRRLVANVLGLPEANQIEVGADLIARSLAARSGGAQDDGLRERITALAADMYDPEQPTSVLSHMSRLLRRALAGPDDARQDGAR
jgi:hypothetical protein